MSELQLKELHQRLLHFYLLGAASLSVPLKGTGSANPRCWMLPAGHSPHLLSPPVDHQVMGPAAWKCLAHEGGINKVVYPFYMRIKKGGSQVFVLVLNSCAAGTGFGAATAYRCYLSSCPARKLSEMGRHMLQASCR